LPALKLKNKKQNNKTLFGKKGQHAVRTLFRATASTTGSLGSGVPALVDMKRAPLVKAWGCFLRSMSSLLTQWSAVPSSGERWRSEEPEKRMALLALYIVRRCTLQSVIS
jgi:hypothetical protein